MTTTAVAPPPRFHLDRVRLRPRPKYVSIALCAAHQAISYRRTLVIGVLSGALVLLIQFSLWRSVFQATPRVGRFDWPAMQTYVLLSFWLNALLSNRAETRMFLDIKYGDIASELVRPTNYLLSRLAHAIGLAAPEGALALGVVGALALAFPGVRGVASTAAAAALPLSVALGFLIKFLIGYMVALLGFRILNLGGVLWTLTAVTNIFSGALVPIELFPEPLRTLATLLPFRGMIHTPLSIYLGDHSAAALAGAIGHQLFWVLALALMARRLWAESLRRLSVQGG